jgi:hypothetical protein
MAQSFPFPTKSPNPLAIFGRPTGGAPLAQPNGLGYSNQTISRPEGTRSHPNDSDWHVPSRLKLSSDPAAIPFSFYNHVLELKMLYFPFPSKLLDLFGRPTGGAPSAQPNGLGRSNQTISRPERTRTRNSFSRSSLRILAAGSMVRMPTITCMIKMRQLKKLTRLPH